MYNTSLVLSGVADVHWRACNYVRTSLDPENTLKTNPWIGGLVIQNHPFHETSILKGQHAWTLSLSASVLDYPAPYMMHSPLAVGRVLAALLLVSNNVLAAPSLRKAQGTVVAITGRKAAVGGAVYMCVCECRLIASCTL